MGHQNNPIERPACMFRPAELEMEPAVLLGEVHKRFLDAPTAAHLHVRVAHEAVHDMILVAISRVAAGSHLFLDHERMFVAELGPEP